MALSGSFEVVIDSTKKAWKKITWSAKKNHAANSYTITSNLYIKRSDDYGSYGTCSAWLQYGSSTNRSSTFSKHLEIGGGYGRDYKLIGSFTKTIRASSNGSLTFELKGYITNFPGNAMDQDCNTTHQRTIAKDITPDQIQRYSIKYSANGGTGAPSAQTKIESVSIAISSTKPTRAGHTFSRWNTNSSGTGTSYNPGISYTSNANLSLYAIWNVNTYNVAFNANGGTGTMTDLTNRKYGTSFTMSANSYKRTGFTFKNWNTKPDGSGTSYSSGSSYSNLTTSNGVTVTLYAIWNANSYSVQFNPNSGSGTMAAMSCKYALKYNLTPNSFTRIGYTFTGWNTLSDGSGTSYSNSQSISNMTATNGSSVTLYAQWTANSYIVTFEPNGSSVPITNKPVIFDAEYGLLPTPTDRSGYTFNGWYTSVSGGTKYTDKTVVSITDNHTLYAQWTANTYTLYYNANGGIVSPSSKSVIFASNYGTIPNPTRDGFTFGGWYKETSYTNPVVSSTSYVTAGNSTIYAKWTANQYTVTFDASGGTVSPAATTVTFGQPYGTIPIPVKTNMTFLNWTLNGKPVYATTVVNTVGDHTLAATYATTVYTVTIKSKFGSQWETYQTSQCAAGCLINTISVPDKKGYDFKGYYSDAALQNKISDTFAITSDITIYAKFSQRGVITIFEDGLLRDYYVYGKLNDKVSRFVPYSTHVSVGLNVDYNTGVCTRIGHASRLHAGADFDKFKPYGGRKRCNVADDGAITAWYGDENFKEDGSNGQVMVYQPKFYYKVEPTTSRNLLLQSSVPLTTSDYLAATYDFGNEKPIAGETYTLQVKGQLGAEKQYFGVYNSGGYVRPTELYPEDRVNGIYTKTFTWKDKNSTHTADNSYIEIYALPSSVTTESAIEWVKLEKGNKATDWTPAPEDNDPRSFKQMNYYVSAYPQNGFQLHPAFYNESGKEVDYILYSAYEGCLYDTSTSQYNLTDEQNMDVTADKLSSVSAAKPVSGLSQAFTRENAEKVAQNRGVGWHIDTIKSVSAQQLLMMIEMGTLDVQSAIGQGVVSILDNSAYNCSSLTGSTSSLGNTTGSAAETMNEIGGVQTTYNNDGKRAITYRGVENPWGNIWKLVNGINFYGDGAMGGGQPYICSDFNFAESKNSDNYVGAGFTIANATGYISAMGYSVDCDWLFLPSETLGNSSIPVGDCAYVTSNANGYRLSRYGSYWNENSGAGAFSWNTINVQGAYARSFGARLNHTPNN